MSTPPVILMLSGSLRADSSNEAVLRTAYAVAPDARIGAVLHDGLGELPHFNPDNDTDPLPVPVVELRAAIERAAGVLICTPEYAGTLPGSFKNLLDGTVGGTEISDKPVAWVNAAAPGRGGGAEATLRTDSSPTRRYVGNSARCWGCWWRPSHLGRERTVPHTLNPWRQQLGEVTESVWQDTELQVLILADNGLTDL